MNSSDWCDTTFCIPPVLSLWNPSCLWVNMKSLDECANSNSSFGLRIHDCCLGIVPFLCISVLDGVYWDDVDGRFRSLIIPTC